MDYGDTYNGKNVFTDLGFIIQHDREKLLAAHDRKAVTSYDWVEQNGSSYHLPIARTKDAEVSLRCVFSPNVANEAEFWQYHEKFVYQISAPGWNKLYIADHNKTYKVFYLRMENVDNKTKRIEGVRRLFIKFNLVLKVAPNYLHTWKRHAELFPEEYKVNWTNGLKFLEHRKPVSKKNQEAATILTELNFNVILLPHYYKPVATGTGIWEKQCDALINNRLSEIYNLKSDLTDKHLFKAIRECYKKKPHFIVLFSSTNLIVDAELIKLELIKALNQFSHYIGPPIFKELIIVDRAGTLVKHKIK